jgi:hypothetical protein
MIAMLANHGFTALETIVNGLSIGFLLEFDSLGLAVLLDGKIAAKTKRQLTEIMDTGSDAYFHTYSLRRSCIRGVLIFIYLNVNFGLLHIYGDCEAMFLVPYFYTSWCFLPFAAITEELLVSTPLGEINDLGSNARVKAVILKWSLVLLDILVGFGFLQGIYAWADDAFYGYEHH